MIISKDLKFSMQCLRAKNKADSMLGIINSGVLYKSSEGISVRVLFTILDTHKCKGRRYAERGSEKGN